MKIMKPYRRRAVSAQDRRHWVRTSITACAAMAAAGVAPSVGAQAYPSKVIRLIVSQPPGGGNDTIARMVAERIAKPLKQQVIVDNRAARAESSPRNWLRSRRPMATHYSSGTSPRSPSSRIS